MSGEDGILGNLPRERPGTRSGKREAATAGPTRKAAPKPRISDPKATQATPAAGPRGATKARPAPPVGTDPVGEAARVAGQVAGAGLRVAARVAGGVVGRLSRP